MKKSVLLCLLVFVILVTLGFVLKYFILDSVFNTRAVTQTITLNITVDMYPPDLIVYSPISTDYSGDKIEIKYSVSDSGSGVDSVWYNIDNGKNVTLTGDTAVTVSEGQHVLHIYASDKARLVNDTEFVTFSVK